MKPVCCDSGDLVHTHLAHKGSADSIQHHDQEGLRTVVTAAHQGAEVVAPRLWADVFAYSAYSLLPTSRAATEERRQIARDRIQSSGDRVLLEPCQPDFLRPLYIAARFP